MSKDNAKNNYSSIDYAQKKIKIKMYLQANGFKGLKHTFTNNGV